MGGTNGDGCNLSRISHADGGDFNVTLEVRDRPNNAGGQDPDSKGFWTFLLEAELHEMGPVNCLYTWSTNCNTMPSWLVRFLCLIGLVEWYPLADV